MDSLEKVHNFEPVIASLDVAFCMLLLPWFVLALGHLHQLEPRNIQVVQHVLALQELGHLLNEGYGEVLNIVFICFIRICINSIQKTFLERHLPLLFAPLFNLRVKQEVVANSQVFKG